MSIRKREVFYFSGYDPRGTRHYYNLYKKEAKKEESKGHKFDISSRERVAENIVKWDISFKNTKTLYHFLEWDDIIRSRWDKNFFDLVIGAIYALKNYLFGGIVSKYMRVAKGIVVAGFYPIVYLILIFFTSIFLTDKLYHILNGNSLSFSSFFIIAISLGVGYSILSFFTKLGNKMAVFWILRIYVFALEYAEKDDKTLKERVDKFAEYISKRVENAKKNNADEILIVSHSVGTLLTIPLMKKVFEILHQKDISSLPKISIMTLGECIPIVSVLPKANEYREQMELLSKEKDLIWLDYTTPIDGACFPLLDFYSFSGVKYYSVNKPKYLSPRFHTLFSKNTYKRLKKDKYLTHFIYLMSTELDGDYNFFIMTAGDASLSELYIKIKDKEKS